MQKPVNHIIIIFGASGDLTRRKLLPALVDLYEKKLMPDEFAILGLGRTKMDNDTFRDQMISAIARFNDQGKPDTEFTGRLHYMPLDYNRSEDYISLKAKVNELKQSTRCGSNVLFYLATPPDLYGKIPEKLASVELNEPGHKIIIEKPFGSDLESAVHLNRHLQKYFQEDQIYRIDHYLGKETVQNILVMRFSNNIFEPLWNRNYIHRVEITSAESIGVEKRGGYYDRSGALRDMVQNHLLQLTGLIAMEPPVNADADSIRNEIRKVFLSLRPLKKEEIRKQVIRGQYTESMFRGEKVNSYRREEGVEETSKTETYAALKFFIDNWRWNGVPFYIRSGKRLPTRVTEVVIHFKPTPHHIFCADNGKQNEVNQLIIRIQPDEGILMKFGMKVPGAGFLVHNVNMDFHYSDLSNVRLPDAYERLLLDCMQNDQTLYARADSLEETWKFINPILQEWNTNSEIPLYGYPAGTWGPDVADELIQEPEITWRYPCKNLSNDGIYCEL